MYALLNDFSKLSPPPAEEVAKREELVRDIIEKLGHKYRLSRPMPKITKDKQ